MKSERFVRNIIIAVLLVAVLWFGILPRITGVSFQDYFKKIQAGTYSFEENEYAVIVLGSEPEGLAAAIASARTGLKTLLVTEEDDLSSYIGNSMIAEMKPDEGVIGGRKVILNKGLYEELFGKLKVGFGTEDYLASVNNLVKKEKSLDIRYNVSLQEVLVENRNVKGIRVSDQKGETYYEAPVFIDATRSGKFLDMCNVPYTLGSGDLNLPDAYMPLEFNFMISGVKWEDLGEIQKTSDFALEFKNTLMLYERSYPRTKIISPTFIKQSEDTFVITGIRQWGVDVNDPEDLKQAYKDALNEALMLTAYMKDAFIPFKDCTFKAAPDALYIPEHKHYQGRGILKVEDILNQKDFSNKIALASAPVDAGKFVGQGYDYVVADPGIYSIPLDAILPVNLDNVLMAGPKASYRSLAATSAGTIPTSITVGESAGLTGAYCFINNKKPGDLANLSDIQAREFEDFLKRGGIYLSPFNEKIKVGMTETLLESHWAYPYVVQLAEYGLISGGLVNDFRLDFEASCEVMAILLKNAMVKMAPDSYSLAFDKKLQAFENPQKLTGETACAMILTAYGKTFEAGSAYETANQLGLIPKASDGKWTKDANLTLDTVYCLVVETARTLAQ